MKKRGADPGFFVGVAELKKLGQFGPHGPHMAPNLVLQLHFCAIRFSRTRFQIVFNGGALVLPIEIKCTEMSHLVHHTSPSF